MSHLNFVSATMRLLLPNVLSAAIMFLLSLSLLLNIAIVFRFTNTETKV